MGKPRAQGLAFDFVDVAEGLWEDVSEISWDATLGAVLRDAVTTTSVRRVPDVDHAGVVHSVEPCGPLLIGITDEAVYLTALAKLEAKGELADLVNVGVRRLPVDQPPASISVQTGFGGPVASPAATVWTFVWTPSEFGILSSSSDDEELMRTLAAAFGWPS